MDLCDFTGVFIRITASEFSKMIVEDVTSQMKLARLFRMIEDEVDVNPIIRNLVANGIGPFVTRQFMLEGKVIQSPVFAASLKRSILLWNLLLKELETTSNCPQRLLLKLEYCQRFCIQAFDSSPLDTKQSMGSDNSASISFALELSAAILQGLLPTEPNQMAATLISFFQQFCQYIPCGTVPIHPSHCKEVLAKLVSTPQLNKHQEAALELVMTTVLHSVTYYGWHATIGDVNTETLFMTRVHSQIDKLSIVTKALLAYKPNTSGIEVLLNREQLCLIVKQLSFAGTSESKSKEYSVREILTVTMAITRVFANCTGLLEEGVEKALDALMEQDDESTNDIAAKITWRIAAAASGGVDVEISMDSMAGRKFSEKAAESKWGSTSPQATDPDGTIAHIDVLLSQMANLLGGHDLFAREKVLTVETVLFAVFDIFWQSEIKLKNAIAELFGDKYIQCLWNVILHQSLELKGKIMDIASMVLIQEMARQSAYFCEKACAGGLIGLLLFTMKSYMSLEVNQTTLDYRLAVLFYCAHIKMFQYSIFGMLNAFDTLTSFLHYPAAHTRLITRLVICCLVPIMEDHHRALLKMTEEESQLLLTYIEDPKLTGGFDRAKFIMAASVLYREFCSQNALGPVAGIIAENIAEQIFQPYDNRVLEGILCLLWTLSHTPEIAQAVSQIHQFVPALKQMQQSSCSEVSLLAKSVLWQLGCGNYKDHAECYIHACTCLHYGFYTECINQCDQFIAAPTSSLHGVARQVRGKAYAHLHQNQFWHIMKQAKLDVAVPWKRGDFVDQCATKAKKAVQDLGFALDNGVLDEEGSCLMDVAMLHFVRIKHQLRDCNRCLLCRRRGMKLKESHTCPRFLQKEIFKVDKKRAQELGIADFEDSIHSSFGRFCSHTPNTMTFAILCGRCEQCLSQNGEDQFQKDVLPLIFRTSDEIHTIAYNSALYSFCLGIIFRSFVHGWLLGYSNFSEMYSLLVACRQHILSLPVKFSDKEVVSSPPILPGAIPMRPIEVFLYINPIKLHVANSRVFPLAASVVAGFGPVYLTTPLSTEPKSKCIVCHALVVRLAPCSIVVPLSPAQGGSLDTNFRINPGGGNYQVLPDTSRWKTIPRGLLQVFTQHAIGIAKQNEQVLSGMKTTKKDSKNVESLIETFTRQFLPQQPIDAISLQSLPPEEVELITTFLSDSSLLVKVLPEDFNLITGVSPQIVLRKGYMLLYHIHDEQQGATIFFAANPEGIAFGKLTVIMRFIDENESFERTEGVNVHIREDGNSCSICVTGYLAEPTTEKLRETQHLRHKTVSERVGKALNILVQKCGSPKVFLRHARLQMRLKDNQCLDHRCSSNGCWYCKDRCHICMKPANQGYSHLPSKGVKFKHCSIECKSIIDVVPKFPVKLLPVIPLKNGENEDIILASITGCLTSTISACTVVQVSICISTERSSVTFGRPSAVVQLRTQAQHLFFSVYLSDDFSPIEPVDSFPVAFSFQMLKDSSILTQILRLSLYPQGLFSFSHLLQHVAKADATLAKTFCFTCTTYESTLPVEDTLVSLNSMVSEEELFSKWIVEQVMLACDDKGNVPQLQPSGNLSQLSTPQLLSTNTCSVLFWSYAQLTCLLWKKAWNKKCGLLVEKLQYTVHITVNLYEQCPSDVQNCIISKFCSSTQILLLCSELAIIAIKGELLLNLHQSAVQFLLLAHKLIATVSSDTMELISVRHLCQKIKGLLEEDVQKLSKVSAVAQQWLLTLMLKSLCCSDSSTIEAAPILLDSIPRFLKSSFIGVVIIAKAMVVHLLKYVPRVGSDVSDTGILDKEMEFLTRVIHDLCQDSLKRRYYLYCVLQVLTLLCSQPTSANILASHSIVSALETLMECAREHEDIIANVVWKITTGGGAESNAERIDKSSSGEAYGPEVDISLEIEQGICYTLDKLLMIIHEFCNIYLECKHIPESYACTVSSVAQLLCGLHQVMERAEKEEVAESVAQHTAILAVLGSAISKHRESWLRIFNGIRTRSAIESLLIMWTDCSKTISQAMIGVGVLTAIVNTLYWAIDYEVLTASEAKCLQNQVLIIYNISQQCPKQTAFQVQLTPFQPLLCCSLLPIRVLSKSVVAVLTNHRDISDVTNLSLRNDEAMFFANGFTSFINSGSASVSGLNLSGEVLLYSLKCLTSLPSDKTCCALPNVLDTVLTLCLHDDKTIAKLALEVIWNISMEPTVALAILCHESVIDTLKRMSVFTCGLASLTRNILWILGYGDVNGIFGCYDYAIACYQVCKYTEAVTWCDHVINMVGATHDVLSAVKSCKGKALARIYLNEQNQRLLGSDQWAMLGYDNNLNVIELLTQHNLSTHPPNKVLSELASADLQKWKNLCSQGQQAIQLLGELLDSGELDEEGSELIDLVMMDYYKETGETNNCKRCLICRTTGELVPIMLNHTSSEVENSGEHNILSLHSFMYIDGSQIIFMFCRECDCLLSQYSDQHLEFMIEAISFIQRRPTIYGREVYLDFIAKVAVGLSMAYNCHFSNYKDVYNTFVACRQILLSHDIYSSSIMFPKIHLFNNPNSWYIFRNQRCELYQSSKYVNAMVASKQAIDKGRDPHEPHFFVMHTGVWNLVVDFGSGKGDYDPIPLEYLIHPTGGSYPVPPVNERWEAFPPDLVQTFHDIVSADERRHVFQSILKSAGKDISDESNFRLLSSSAKYWLPSKKLLSFLPEGISLEVDSDIIQNISLPVGHKILGHHHDHDKALTIFLAYGSDSKSQEKQFYFILTCRLSNYLVADAVFLNGNVKNPFSNPIMFPMCSSLSIREVVMVRLLLVQEFPPISSYFSLVPLLIKHGQFGFKGVSTYEDITRNCNLAVSVDTRCSPEGCWYCQYRCHSCLKPAAIGYTWKDDDEKLFYHCSERCYYMYTADIPDSTILDVKIGELQPQPVDGTHLLLSATVLLHTSLSKNTIVSTQVAVSYGCHEIPSGVVYVLSRLNTLKDGLPPVVLFIQHDLSPVKCVNEMVPDIAGHWREKSWIKSNLQPVFDDLGCDDLPGFLQKNFPLLGISYMKLNGTIYSWPPTSERASQVKASANGVKDKGVMVPP